ncbi:MAG: SurA N-terminal domain-containing protein [Candidatus Anaerobiospirillum pullicola]|uniref:Periplasmic chaperone PpiD n=1 Tax=Candidatus Anaerobiospirillum pullicola TaxID=2838451 RepID=A0A948TII3_9GAMM|nr:SurA N-terminal domain-containing protein [Candidatus Anaerobiospirillum pullicola]
MLSDKLHAGANSKLFKALLALIVVSFVLTSVASYLIPRLDTDPVTIGEYKITSSEWTEQYNRRAQQLHRYGAEVAGLLENPQYVVELKKQVLESMINNVAFNSAVWNMDVRIGDEQVREVIRDTPAFQQDGRFNNDLYLATVRNMGMNPEYFGEQLRVSLMSESVSRPLMAAATTPMPYELRNIASLLAQRRIVNLYTVDSAAIAEGVTVSEEQAQAYYNAHHDEFMAPANVRFNYLLLSLDDLKKQVEVTDAKLEEFFNLYQEDFALPEQRRIGHIIIRANSENAAERVQKVEQALASGESFADVAKQYSDDAATKDKGGDMGTYRRGELAANLDQAAFDLQNVGDVSAKIEDGAGTHFVSLLEVIPAHTPSLDEVKDQVTTAYTDSQAREMFNEKLTTMSDMSFENPDSLDVTAESLGMTIQDSQRLNECDRSAPWPLNTQAVQRLAFNEEVYTSGVNSQVISIDENNSIVINVVEHHDKSLRPFAEVKDLALETVKQEHINKLAYDTLEQTAKALQADPNAALPEHVSVQANVEIAAGTSSVAPQYSQAIFALPRQVERAYTIALNNGTETLAVLQEVKDGDSATLQTFEQILAAQYGQYLGINAQNALYRQARSLTKIEYNQDAIDLVTQNN